jgi:hypothetical protein
MSCPNIITLNNNKYYSAEELHKYDIAFFAGIYKNIRNIIKNKKLTIDNYKYAYINKKGIWIESKESYARAKILLEADWVENNVPKIIVAKKQESKIPLIIKKQKSKLNNTIIIKNEIKQENDDIKIENLYDIPPAPEVLELADNEKFTDSNGNILNIEVRGERNHLKCYFKVKDVSKEFNMPKLRDTLIDKSSSYEENIDYFYFMIEKTINNYNKLRVKKELFLTFEGLMRILFNTPDSRTKEINIVNNIIKNINSNWICNKSLKCGYRPDMYTVSNNCIIMIEIDEYQHKTYINEESRIHYIYKELNKKNMTIIRINPDKYKDSNNIIYNSIASDINEFNKRMNIIIDTVKNIIETNKEGLNTIYLFYDNYTLINSNNNNNYDYSINEKHNKLCKIRSKFIQDNFIFKMGTYEQKEVLVSDILGVSTDAVKEVCKKSIIKISCVYLFSLGYVKELRNSFNIPSNFNDDMIVIKYGRTDSLERRTSEHEKDYGKIENVDLRLMKYAFIDSQYTADAESDLSNFFNYSKYKYDFINRNELAIIPKDKMNIVEREYEKIRKIYAGNLAEIINEKEKLINELRIKDKDIQLIEEKHKNELQQEKHKNEILQMKLIIAEMKNNNEYHKK